MSKIIKIELNQEAVSYIESVQYQLTSRKNLLLTIAKEIGVNSDAFKDYEKEYVKYDYTYKLIKDELSKVFIPEELKTHQTSWSLDYKTNLLTIEILCECGIKLVESGSISFVPGRHIDNMIDKLNN